MKSSNILIILAVLLAASIVTIIYLLVSNPVRGHKLVYDRNNYKLFYKDTVKNKGDTVAKKDETTTANYSHGRRIKHQEGVDMIKKYQGEIVTTEDAIKMTKYVDFTFDNLFSYMGYILSIKDDILGAGDNLGFRIYIGTHLTPTTIEGREVYQHTMVLAPIKDHALYKFVYDGDFDFFNQGSICPVNCPDDGGLFKD